MQNVVALMPGLLLEGIRLSSAILLAGVLATSGSADAANSKKILSRKDAVSVVKGAGFKNIKTQSCGIPYTFSAKKDDCTFMINVTADGRWTGFQTGCETTISEPVQSGG